MRPLVLLGPLSLVGAACVVFALGQPRLRGDESDAAPGFDRVERAIRAKDWSNPTPALTLVKKSPVRKDKLDLADAAWRGRLKPEAFDVLRNGGTEPPFTSPLLGVRGRGKFVCAGCGTPLFRTEAKFDSHTGWPSFVQPLEAEMVWYRLDPRSGTRLTEALCARCDGHLGHVFPDGPKARGGLRYCIDGVALRFVPDGK